MDHLASMRARDYSVGTAERMGIVKVVLNGSNVCDELWDLFMHLPETHLCETFSILLHYHVPDRHLITQLLQHREPCVKALPPSHLQLGYLREPDNLWNNPLPASRHSLWDYLLFRWSMQYFDKTLQLMLKTISAFDDVRDLSNIQTVLTSSIVAHHSTMLVLLAPRARLILEETDYCRDSLEYSDLLLLTQYIFMSAEIPRDLKLQMPFERLFQWGAGMNPHIHSMAFRSDALLAVASVDHDILQAWVRECTDPHLIPSLCRILTEFPSDIHYIAILALSFSNLLIDIAWDNWHFPFLYESAIHVILSAIPGDNCSSGFILNAVIASHLFLRFSLAFPRRNIIETCFYAFSTALQRVQADQVFKHQIEENLRAGMATNGNRSIFISLVSLQDSDVQDNWTALFPSIVWPETTGPRDFDSVTEQPIVKKWHFEDNDDTPVGLETIIHHIASNGLRNPFTNLAVTWEHLLAVNRKM